MRIAHIADPHLGYRAYNRITSQGINRREADVFKAFQSALAKALWPEPRRMYTRRTTDLFYSDRGTEVASRHVLLKRGKVVSETLLVNDDYLQQKGHA